MFYINKVINNKEPIYTINISGPSSGVNWIWFPILKVGSTAIRGMINRHLVPMCTEKKKENSPTGHIKYENITLTSTGIIYNSTAPKHKLNRQLEWTESNPVCMTDVIFTESNSIDNYIKFTFTRNPYSRFVSCWSDMRYTNKKITGFEEQIPFSEFVYKHQNTNMYTHPNRHIQSQSSVIHGIDMDYIGQLEHLHDHFGELCEMMNIERPAETLHKNKTKHKHYTEYYDDELKDIVTELYKEDLDMFDYKFGD